MVRPLLLSLERKLGVDGYEALLLRAGLGEVDHRALDNWISLAQFDALCAEAWKSCGTDKEFEYLCSTMMREGYGPLFSILPDPSPSLWFGVFARTMPLACNFLHMEVLEGSANFVRLKIELDGGITPHRLLYRNAVWAHMPTISGLPVGEVRVVSTTGTDPTEEILEIRYPLRTSKWWPVAGLSIGLGLGLAFVVGLDAHPVTAILSAALGTSFGLLRQVRADGERERKAATDSADAIFHLENEARAAVRQLAFLRERENEWRERVREASQPRATARDVVLGEIQAAVEDRSRAVKGLSHDIRNPLAVLRLVPDHIRDLHPDAHPELQEVLEMHEASVDRITLLLEELAETVQNRGPLLRLRPEVFSLPNWLAQLDRRLGALCFEKDLRWSVQMEPGTPATVEADRVLLDRILDNLLTNAAKYTSAGAIQIRIGNNADRWWVEVEDSGRGIPSERLRNIFLPGGSQAEERAAHSLGLGLSVVVQLVDLVDGELEVWSSVGQGTRLRVHLPFRLPTSSEIHTIPDDDSRVSRRVRLHTEIVHARAG